MREENAAVDWKKRRFLGLRMKKADWIFMRKEMKKTNRGQLAW